MKRSVLSVILLACAVHSAAQAPEPTAEDLAKPARWFVDCSGNRPTTLTVRVTKAGDYQIPAELVLMRCFDGKPV
jgi:invasion protein IalB